MIPLAAAGIALLAASTGCDLANSYSSAPGQDTMQDMATAGDTPALNAVSAFDLGPMVVDGGGFTVYRYDKDSINPPRSTCTGACAQQWKPIPASATQQLSGLDQAGVGTMTRDDGTDQATLGGWPLYRYANDAMPGETAGLGVGGVWHPITPQGGKVLVVANPGQSDAFGL